MMSSKKDRKKNAPMPMSSAGLLQFFEDEVDGIKIGPVATIAVSISLIIFALLVNFV